MRVCCVTSCNNRCSNVHYQINDSIESASWVIFSFFSPGFFSNSRHSIFPLWNEVNRKKEAWKKCTTVIVSLQDFPHQLEKFCGRLRVDSEVCEYPVEILPLCSSLRNFLPKQLRSWNIYKQVCSTPAIFYDNDERRK